MIGASWMAFGILFSVIAAVIQSIQTLQIRLIWIIDHNGLFHLIQIIGITFLYAGISKELNKRSK